MGNIEEKNEQNTKDSNTAVQKPPQTNVSGKSNPQKRFFKRRGNFKKYNQNRSQPQNHGPNLANKMITIVIPLYNEEESIVELSIALKKVLESLRANYEVIFIDDGSTDISFNKI